MSEHRNQSLKPHLGGILDGLLRQADEVRATQAPRPAGTAVCPRCKGEGYRIEAKGPTAVAVPCGCERACGRCGGRGFSIRRNERGYEFHEPCECQTLPRRIALYDAAQLPALFAEKGFDGFYVDEHDPKELRIAKRQLREFAETALVGQSRIGVGLLGQPGTGKTHLLVAALAHLTLKRGIPCRYLEMSLLFADHKAAISDERARAALERLDRLASVEILAIDELGKGRASQFELEILDELVSRRYNNGRLTLFASNHPLHRREAPAGADPRARPEPFAESLEDKVGPRIFSRLHAMAAFYEIPGRRDRRRHA